jgi:DNA-binding response OmpR family regulator
MESTNPWIAFLNEDEDDVIFWQYGFNNWAQGLNLHWFKNTNEFWAGNTLLAQKPAFILQAELFPLEQDRDQLKIFLQQASSQQVPVFLVASTIQEEEREQYREWGVTDCLLYPCSVDELRKCILSLVNWTRQD